MAIINTGNQYKYTGRSPVDAKMLVKTYNELFLEDTWLVSGKNCAYNGMIVAVGLNKEDASKNGIYYLHDATVTSTFTAPNVTLESNWHKLCTIDEIASFAESLSSIQTELQELSDKVDNLNGEASVESYGYMNSLPTVGEAGKLYVVEDVAKTYAWISNQYVCVGEKNPSIIYGGNA